MARATFTFLGTSTSVGVPVIGCSCDVCRSDDPRNKRLRSSALVRCGEVAVLVDSGPDLRAQALREGITAIDAVVYTHSHLDHIAGFDELRAFCWHKEEPLPLHATPGCMKTLTGMYGWAFSPDNVVKGYVNPEGRLIDGPFDCGPLRITPLPVEHAGVETIGFLFEPPGGRAIAYLPDVKRIPGETLALVRGVDVLAIDSLRPRPHPTHMSIGEALAAVAGIAPGEAWLTHLGHENDHRSLAASLPPGIDVAWDGLTLDLAR